MTQPLLDALLGHLPDHSRVVSRLLEAVEADPDWRWLELGCSIAQERGDALSDLDLGLGVDDAAWPEALTRLPDLAVRPDRLVRFVAARLEMPPEE